MEQKITPIGTIYTDFPEKFGLPRQSGLVDELSGKIVFNSPYNVKEAFDGIEEFSHIWVLWLFSENTAEKFSPTVRPPRLGGEIRKGVFATRSPFRPNSIGISCVRLIKAEQTKSHGVVLTVGGIDIKNETPVIDIKPYIPLADCKTGALAGFSKMNENYELEVYFPQEFMKKIPLAKQKGLIGILKQDPRPAYQNDSGRIYGLSYAGFNIKFTVNGKKLAVIDVEKL